MAGDGTDDATRYHRAPATTSTRPPGRLRDSVPPRAFLSRPFPAPAVAPLSKLSASPLETPRAALPHPPRPTARWLSRRQPASGCDCAALTPLRDGSGPWRRLSKRSRGLVPQEGLPGCGGGRLDGGFARPGLAGRRRRSAAPPHRRPAAWRHPQSWPDRWPGSRCVIIPSPHRREAALRLHGLVSLELCESGDAVRPSCLRRILRTNGLMHGRWEGGRVRRGMPGYCGNALAEDVLSCCLLPPSHITDLMDSGFGKESERRDLCCTSAWLAN